MALVRVKFPPSRTPNTFQYFFCSEDGTKTSDVHSTGEFEFSVPDDSLPHCVIVARGFWQSRSKRRRHVYDVVPKLLPETGPLSWWHKLHGVDSSDTSRGTGVRIGIVDVELPRGRQLGCVSHVRNLGLGPDATLNSSDPTDSHWHAMAVTSLVAARPNKHIMYEGLAPGAEVYFMSARSPWDANKTNAQRVANAIDHLSGHLECDIITISSGDQVKPLTVIESSIKRAKDRGTLCFFASGNEGEVRYPAAYDDALAVSAIGRFGFAPRPTYEHFDEKDGTPLPDGEHFLWTRSGIGAKVLFAAAGVGVIYTEGIAAAATVTGTSFASPIAAGTAAAILGKVDAWKAMPRTGERWNEMLEILFTRSEHTMLPMWGDKGGILRCPA